MILAIVNYIFNKATNLDKRQTETRSQSQFIK